jgi:hypothetical protein
MVQAQICLLVATNDRERLLEDPEEGLRFALVLDVQLKRAVRPARFQE